MHWPWVSRARYDVLARNYEGVRERLYATFDARDKEFARLHASWRTSDARLELRYSALLEKYHSLRVIGAVEMPSVKYDREPARIYNNDPVGFDDLRALIHERAGSDYRKRGMMLRQLTADRAAGKSDDAIRAEIEHGIEGNGVPV